MSLTRQLLQYSAAQALAEGRPLGTALRGSLDPNAAEAADLVDAGDLSLGLSRIGFQPDLVAVATTWPQAVLPGLRRLSQLPPGRVFQAPALQTLGYFGIVALVEVLLFSVLRTKGLIGVLAEVGPSADLELARSTAALSGAAAALILLAVPVVAWALLRVKGQRGSWNRHLRRAREACLAAALWETAAPADVRQRFERQCVELVGGGTLKELEIIATHALSRAVASHARFLTALRFAGYGALLALPVTTTFTVYRLIAHMGLKL